MQLPLLIRASCIGISIDSHSNVGVKIGGNVFQLPFVKIIILRKAADNAASSLRTIAKIKGKDSEISLYKDVVDIVCRQIRSSFVKWLCQVLF